MTGFGKAVKELNGKSITVELRSLNSRFCDLAVKIPLAFRSHDMEIRSLLTQTLLRGKIDLTLTMSGATEYIQINRERFTSYYKQLSALADDLGADTHDLVNAVMQLPDVVSSDDSEISDSEWAFSLQAMKESLVQLIAFRKREGEAMRNDLLQRLQLMRDALASVEKREPKRHERIRQRITGNLQQWMNSGEYDKNRFEQELLYYIEKMDVNEEIVRLKSHIEHFTECLSEGGEEKGKKLSFIAQEMGREINTISSKANDADMQKLVVGMKDELEKVKELLLNVL